MATTQLSIFDDVDDPCRKCEKQNENNPVPVGCPLIEMVQKTRAIDPDVVGCL